MSIHSSDVYFKAFRNYSDSESAAMNVNGAVTPVNFDVIHPRLFSTPEQREGDLLLIYRVTLTIIDATQSPTKFGGIAALSNGLRMTVCDTDGNESLDFLDGLSIKKNADWVWLAGIDNPVTAAAGDDEFAVRWTLSSGLGGPLCLKSDERLRAIVRDDLTGLTSFTMIAQGVCGY